MGVKNALTNAGVFLKNNSPTILMLMSIGGIALTVITAHNDTLKAEDILYSEGIDPKNRREVIKATWKCYIPTAISSVSTAACMVGSHYCSNKQKIALSNAYLLSQTTLHEYQKKVIEKIGENKERAVMEETVKSIAEQQAPRANFLTDFKDAVITGHGNTLLYSIPDKTYFRSDINYLKSVMNDINAKLISGYDSLFDWNYIRISFGIPIDDDGNFSGVNVDHMLELTFSPELMDNGDVRVNMNYRTWPLTELRRR